MWPIIVKTSPRYLFPLIGFINTLCPSTNPCCESFATSISILFNLSGLTKHLSSLKYTVPTNESSSRDNILIILPFNYFTMRAACQEGTK